MDDLVTPSADFWRDRRVFLTGHTGFKGAWISVWLEKLGARVFGYALPPTSDCCLFEVSGLAQRVDSTTGDIRNFDDLLAAMARAKPDIVLHMAAQALVRPSYGDPVGTYATNVMGTVHLLEAIRCVDTVRVVINVTSDKCYENGEWCWPYRENEPMGGCDPYSSSKGCAELITAAWRRSFFTGSMADGTPRLASVRAGNVIGGGDWAKDRLIPDCMRALIWKEPLQIRNPSAVRPWQHVLEPLCGYLLMAERLWHDGDAFAEGWNFGPSDEAAQPVSWILARIARLWETDMAWNVQQDNQLHEANYLKVDSSKAQARLGWRPRLDVAKALEWTVEWYAAYRDGASLARHAEDQIERYEKIGVVPQ